MHENRLLKGVCEPKIREVTRLWRNYIMREFGTYVDRDGSVGIATDDGLEGPGIESQCGRDISHVSRPSLGPTQPSVPWPPGHFPGSKVAGAWQ